MEVEEEGASPFTFRFTVKPVIVELQIVFISTNCKHGGSKLLHGNRNVH